jgi:hypothetical protein
MPDFINDIAHFVFLLADLNESIAISALFFT